MNKKFRLGILLIVTLVITAGILSVNLEPTDASYNVLVGPATNQDLSKLSQIDIELSTPKQDAARFDIGAAVKNVQAVYPFTSDAKSISIEYQLITCPFKMISKEALTKNAELEKNRTITDTPSYIISFEGISPPSVSSGPAIKPIQNDTRQEFNVVVDAASGVPLFAFSYR